MTAVTRDRRDTVTEEAGMAKDQRISYVPLDQMDDEMRAEMERCAREGGYWAQR